MRAIARLRGRLAGPFFVLVLGLSPALAAPTPWQREKCTRYAAAWEATIARRGTVGISARFLERHAAFLAGGCLGARDVCPTTQAELDLANILFIRSMNAGMASTFAPFGCPK